MRKKLKKMSEDLKSKTLKGVAWSFIESSSLKVIQFVINIIMARLLLPKDYGIVAIIFVFITISQIFIDGGFATTLIQDKYKTEKDYSTIYTFNIFISILSYLIIYFSAPYISEFYNENLTIYLRIQSLGLIIYSFSAIHKVRMTVDVNFKAIAKVTLLSASVSGCVGIIMAYNGFGVWSLIFQYIISAVMTTILYTVTQKWKPTCFFDINSFKRLFPFGVRLLTASIIDKIYANLYPIIIGKFYTATQLGLYSRAEQFASLAGYTFVNVFDRVTFPVMSTIQEEERLISVYRKYISLSSYVIIPLLLLLVVVSKPLILILLTDKWAEIIPLLQILCFGYILEHVSAINRNLLYVKGRSDLALKLEVIKKLTATAILIISLPFGLIGLCIGKAFYGLLAVFLNSMFTKRLIGLAFKNQVADFMPSLLIGLSCMVVTSLIIYNIHNTWQALLSGTLIFIISYITLSYFFKLNPAIEIKNLIVERIIKK